MKWARYAMIVGVVVGFAAFFPFFGTTTCASGHCVSHRESLARVRYPEWLGDVFYVVLLALLAWGVMAAFKRFGRDE